VSEVVSQFWAEAERLGDGAAELRQEPNGYTELLIPTSAGTLEISGEGEFVSVACGHLFIEDHRLASREDGDFLLAVCDAVLAGRAEVARPRVKAELLTRGHSEIWTA